MNAKILEDWRDAIQALEGDVFAVPPDPPASRADIEFAERTLGRRLPDALLVMLRCSRTWQWREERFDAVVFSAPESIVGDSLEPEDDEDQVNVSETLTPRAKAYFYSSLRTTFAYSDYYFFQIDEDPAEGGAIGQIVMVDQEEETIDVIADSLEEFVTRGIACLRAQKAGGYPHVAD